MKYWEYQILNRSNVGTEEAPVWHEMLMTKRVPQTDANRLIAEKEAYGEITPYDDGQPEPVAPESDSVIWDELDAAYQEGYSEGYQEGVNTAYDQ